jgi:hypothetical protein
MNTAASSHEKQVIEANGTTFTVSASLVNKGVAFPNSNNNDRTHNEFRVYVKTEHGRISFKFYGSTQEFTKAITHVGSLKNALYCFICDALFGEDSFDDFCKKMGYDTDSRNAERIYKSCQKSLGKLKSICPNQDLYEIINCINE